MMLWKTTVLAGALAFSSLASAQSASTPAKKELVAKILLAQQGGIDQLARQLVEQPAMQMLQRAGPVIQNRAAADKREALARDVQADARKFVDDTYPIVRQRAQALAPATIGPLLEDRLSEAELKEVLGVFESAAWRKFQTLAPDMQKVLGEKLVADVKPQVETRLKALDAAVGKRLGLPQPAPASAASSNGK